MANNYYDRYYVEYSDGKAYEIISPGGETSDGYKYMTFAILALADNTCILDNIKDVTPTYVTKISGLPSIHEWAVKNFVEREDSPYTEGNNGVSSFWYTPVNYLSDSIELNQNCYEIFEKRQQERLEFTKFINDLGYSNASEIEGQDKAYDVLYKWFEYDAEITKKEMDAKYAAAEEGKFMLTFNEFLHTLGYESAQEVDYAGATHEVVGAWLDYVNSQQ